MISLVGYTGFVGSNLALSHHFDKLYNSKNIAQAFGTQPDVLYYSGVPAQKFLANKFPEQDLAVVENAFENIKKINPKKIVLISTVDVYKDPNNKTENSPMEQIDLHPYGKNRLLLENWVKETFEDYLIVRLPGLYGANLKKNFIYDYLSFIPALLNENKYNELFQKNAAIGDFYELQENGFYAFKKESNKEKAKKIFEDLGFSALNFTDSRGVFQFYNLKYLYQDIQLAMKNNLKVLNIATEPVSVSEIYHRVTGKTFVNEISEQAPYYDFKSEYAHCYQGTQGYLQNKDFVLKDICAFITENQDKY